MTGADAVLTARAPAIYLIIIGLVGLFGSGSLHLTQ